MPTDPRKIPGSMAGPGGPHAKGGRDHDRRGELANVQPRHLAALLDHAAERWSELSPGERSLLCRLAGIEDGGAR